ncbi:hypothetical protein [Anthocerotibacter panamensis]|uniref:hypothetical protein n=1 Tax=Anthocerotibacter panamensis TaxID=2857077 RepID=UPI001C402397|nr:hypothetical protein [Anthocerotibacter panamensis]
MWGVVIFNGVLIVLVVAFLLGVLRLYQQVDLLARQVEILAQELETALPQVATQIETSRGQLVGLRQLLKTIGAIIRQLPQVPQYYRQARRFLKR